METPWSFPIPGYDRIELPMGDHLGAFGARRKHHRHEGVDLYAPEGTPVFAVEPGIVVAVLPFTGPWADSPWWYDTSCVLIAGPSGVVNYGEIAPSLSPGSLVDRGIIVGTVLRVLRRDKGRPMSMLHLELYAHGTTEPIEWSPEEKKPEVLQDPTSYLVRAEHR